MVPLAEVPDHWSAASTYEHFMGRWSRQLAREFVAWLHAPGGAAWLEIGCGTGALTAAICDLASPGSVVACDPSETFIQYARAHIPDERVSFTVAGADSFPDRPNGYDSITSSLALNFFPNPEQAMQRMYAASSTDGQISACVWDYAEGMQFLRYFWDSAAMISPAAAVQDEGSRFPFCQPDELVELFRGAGLADVRCEPLEIATPFESFEDYWRPFLGATGPAPSLVSSLDERTRAQLRHRLEIDLPIQSDGTIPLTARAWAVRGSRSEPA